MAHFYMEAGAGQIHIYCRDQETYENIFFHSDDEGPLRQIRPGLENTVPPAAERHHLFVNGTTVHAVSLDATSHTGEGAHLAPGVSSAVLELFPDWEIREDGYVPTAPFAAGMLAVLTDF